MEGKQNNIVWQILCRLLPPMAKILYWQAVLRRLDCAGSQWIWQLNYVPCSFGLFWSLKMHLTSDRTGALKITRIIADQMYTPLSSITFN